MDCSPIRGASMTSQEGMSMRPRLIISCALLLLVVTSAVVAKRMAPRLSGYLRDRAVSTLREDFSSDVEFSDLQVAEDALFS